MTRMIHLLEQSIDKDVSSTIEMFIEINILIKLIIKETFFYIKMNYFLCINLELNQSTSCKQFVHHSRSANHICSGIGSLYARPFSSLILSNLSPYINCLKQSPIKMFTQAFLVTSKPC